MAKRAVAPSRAEHAAGGPADLRMLVLHGKDRFIQDDHFQALKQALIKVHGEAGVEVKIYDVLGGGASTEGGGMRMLAEVFDDCRSFGLMSRFKIIVVENAEMLFRGEEQEESAPAKPGKGGRAKSDSSSTARRLLEGYAAEPSDSATLVLRAGGTWRGGNLDKAVIALGSRGAVIKCEPPSEDEAARWAMRQATERHKTKLDAPTAALLVNAVGSDLGRIDSELAKLAVAAGGKGQAITPELVEQMTGTTRQDDLWAIQSRLIGGNPADVLGFLRQLIDVSRSDPVPISWAYVEMARKLHMASRGLSQGLSRGQLAGPMKAWGGMGEVIFAKAERIKPEIAARMLQSCLENDLAGKTGLGEPVRNLEVLTTRICRALEPKPGR